MQENENAPAVSYFEDPRREAVLAELHARPFPRFALPRALTVLAFLTEDDGGRDLDMLARLSLQAGIPAPQSRARTHNLHFGRGFLRWERHTEFTTFAFDEPIAEDCTPSPDRTPFDAAFMALGPMIAGVRVEIRPEAGARPLLAAFDPSSLCHSMMDGRVAECATDFRQDAQGLTRILMLDHGLSPDRAGALATRLVEIEIYRTLALLGLPLAQSVSPALRTLEERLRSIARDMREESRDSQMLLREIIDAAAEVEAMTASTSYRFGASRAYDQIVDERLATVGEEPIPGRESWRAFLNRRMAPALRTSQSVETRQEALATKLSRFANLLRTRIDVELEHQNRDLLASMDRRAQLQLRLQQTVEGLSVAAIAYYVVGLFGYVAEGISAAAPLPLSTTTLKASFAPVAILAVFMIVRRIRAQHSSQG